MLNRFEEKAREILKNHRKVSPTCALLFTEQAIAQALREEATRQRETDARIVDKFTGSIEAVLHELRNQIEELKKCKCKK